MKKIFRFLIQELNGFYVRNIQFSLEAFTAYIYEFFGYFSSIQLFLDTDLDAASKYTQMSNEDIIGIAQTAGIASVLVSAESNLGSIRFPTGNQALVEGRYYTERGLFNLSRELFEFFRTTPDSYSSDINTLASNALRTSLVEPGAPILGYVGESTQIFREDGSIDYSKLLSEPPVGEAYVPFYGEKYLFLAESFIRESFVVPPVLTELLLSSQIIRYNGPSISSFLDVTRTILLDAVKDITFVRAFPNTLVEYYRNADSTQTSVLERLLVWKSIIQDKFPSFILVEKEL